MSKSEIMHKNVTSNRGQTRKAALHKVLFASFFFRKREKEKQKILGTVQNDKFAHL